MFGCEYVFSGQLDRQGISIWAVSWDQTVRTGIDVWTEDGTLPSEVYVNGELLSDSGALS